MRHLILADVHGNLAALEAVLHSPEARSCDHVISLGDQVNYGPQPREVLTRLQNVGALMLLGNHEERILHIDSPDLAGYNWRLLHWTAAQLEGFDLHLPVDVRMGHALLTHGMPGEPNRHLKFDGELPAGLDALPEGVTLLFSGHAHRVWDVAHNGRRAVNPGSLGAGKSQSGSCATFATWEDETDEITLCAAPYDADETARAFLRSGAVEAAPQMCRVVLQTIYTGCEESVTSLVRHAHHTGQAMGLTLADEAAWWAADATFSWTEPLSTPDYWKMLKEKLL